MSISDREYWQFSFEEFGLYDIPAEIQYALDLTAESNPSGKLTYIGHSMGTTQFFAGAVLKNDWYADKVNLFAALAPVVRFDLGHPPSTGLGWAAQHYKVIEAILELVGYYQVLYLNDQAGQVLSNICYYTGPLCAVLLEKDNIHDSV